MGVRTGVERDLKLLGARDGGIPESALAEAALALADAIDDPESSPTSKSLCAKELRETMTLLQKMAPEVAGSDGIDDLAARRAKRLEGKSAAKR